MKLYVTCLSLMSRCLLIVKNYITFRFYNYNYLAKVSNLYSYSSLNYNKKQTNNIDFVVNFPDFFYYF